MSAIASQTTGVAMVYSTVYSGVDQRRLQSSASLALWWELTDESPSQKAYTYPMTDDVTKLRRPSLPGREYNL